MLPDSPVASGWEWGATPIPWTVYRYFDPGDVLLYVGSTVNFRKRQNSHRLFSVWMIAVAGSETVIHPCERDGLAAERTAIETECPVFNRTHNDTEEAHERRCAYVAASPYTELLAPLTEPTEVLLRERSWRQVASWEPWIWPAAEEGVGA